MIYKFQIGDKVNVLDDAIKGEVVKIVGSLITIEEENGFLLNYQDKELIKNEAEKLFQNITITTKDKILENNTILKSKKARINTAVLEVDLHIHQITKTNKNLSNFDMLSKQVGYAKQKIDYAIKNNISNVVFIHGIGQGVLKTEIYKMLKKYKVEINDANYKKYGKGATEIYIYRNN